MCSESQRNLIWIVSKLLFISILFFENSYPAAVKSLQSCLTLCNPIDGSPLGSSIPGILQARIPDWLPFPSPTNESEK